MPEAAKGTTVFRVMLGEEAWTVREDGASATAAFSSKREAVAEARRRAQSKPLACVVVHYADRSVESQTLFHGEPRPTRTFRSLAGDGHARSRAAGKGRPRRRMR
ncbi:MAG TPA: DUF2188 domain-containing protein [Vicinamibacteria bacterium]|nr:DUF2188 domain-containing protein [Vicinamibacteria bacterium]